MSALMPFQVKNRFYKQGIFFSLGQSYALTERIQYNSKVLLILRKKKIAHFVHGAHW